MILMEGLESIAEASLSTQQFYHPPSSQPYNVASISSSEGTTKVTRARVQVGDLPAFLRGPQGEPNTRARLKLIELQRTENGGFCMAPRDFVGVLKIMKASSCVLYLLTQQYDGFHHFPSTGPTKAPTWFLGMSKYALLWTFKPATAETLALFVRRQNDPFTGLVDMLGVYKTCMHTPYLLAFAMCLHMLSYYNGETNKNELVEVRNIELRIGFGPHGRGHMPPGVGLFSDRYCLSDFTRWVQDIGEIQGNVINKLRHVRTIRLTLECVTIDHDIANLIENDVLRATYIRDTEVLRTALPSVRGQVQTYEDFLGYLKDRADKLSNVVGPSGSCTCFPLFDYSADLD
jgi:hypothetical protein